MFSRFVWKAGLLFGEKVETLYKGEIFFYEFSEIRIDIYEGCPSYKVVDFRYNTRLCIEGS